MMLDKKNVPMYKLLDETIVKAVVSKKPETVDQLVKMVQQETNVSGKTILDHILFLQKNGKIKLEVMSSNVTKSVSFIVSGEAKWYWATLLFTAISLFFILQIPENAYPLVYGRYILGSFFVLVVPGYALVRALYLGKEIDNVERLGLSICMSMALSGIVAFFLNFSPWGILFLPLVLTLSMLMMFFATIAIVREVLQLQESTN